MAAKIGVSEVGDERGLVLSAVFKTVCGALLRRPGWVRFPSIPANPAVVTAKMTAIAADVGACRRSAGDRRVPCCPKQWTAVAEVPSWPAPKLAFGSEP